MLISFTTSQSHFLAGACWTQATIGGVQGLFLAIGLEASDPFLMLREPYATEEKKLVLVHDS